MAPPRKYIRKRDLHVNIDEDIKDVGDFFGLKPADLMKLGYIYQINLLIEQQDAPLSIKEKWAEISTRESEEFNAKVSQEKAIVDKAKRTGAQQKISNLQKTSFIEGLISDVFSIITPDEIIWLTKLAKSDTPHLSRQVIPTIKNLYSTRSKKSSPSWSLDEESVVINHLIDLGSI